MTNLTTHPQDGVRVTIYDQEYNMRSQLDPEYIRMLARFVDDKMRAVAVRAHTVDSLRAAILAALNIADEYHQLLSKFNTATQEVDQKVGECHQVVDQLLDMIA